MDREELIAKRLDDFHLPDNKMWAIYGTGDGGEMIFHYFEERHIEDSVVSFIDNDSVADCKESFCGKDVKRLKDVYEKCDGIIIAAIKNHAVIAERINTFFIERGLVFDNVINIFNYYSNSEVRDYLSYIEKTPLKESECFVEISSEHIELSEDDPKIIAWYLPQFHQIELNNRVYGRGFTEWVNTTQTIPMYTGHWQPHIPYDVGYYELNDTEAFRRQIELAKQYGLYGFSFYYYWFSGTKIMDKPVDMYLEDKGLDFPFCLTWANENWTALWDAGNKEVLYEQTLNDEDDVNIISDMLRYMKDDRYIRIDGKPVIIIYRISIFEKNRAKILLDNFRKEAKKNGFEDLYIMVCNSHGFDEDALDWGADALVEFPPHIIAERVKYTPINGYINPYFKGKVKDMTGFIDNKEYLYEHVCNTFYRGAMTSWDNTARKATSGAVVFEGLNPKTFKQWLVDLIRDGKERNGRNNYVFVNSWNEWAEGAHLEPDMKYGYGFLQSLQDAIVESRSQHA